MPTLLLVDGNTAYLHWAASFLFLKSKRDLVLRCARSAGQAVAWLRQKPVDALLTNVQLPDVDGLQLLRLCKKWRPGAAKIAYLSQATGDFANRCQQAGAALVPKPKSFEELQGLFQLLRTQPGLECRSHEGPLPQFQLKDVLEMYGSGGNSVILEIVSSSLSGRIHMEEGQIVQAQTSQADGVEAVLELLGATGLKCTALPFTEPVSRTVREPLESLLYRFETQKSGGVGRTLGPSQPVRLPTGNPAGSLTAPVELVVVAEDGRQVLAQNSPDPGLRCDLLEFINVRLAQLNRSTRFTGFQSLELEGVDFNAVVEFLPQGSGFALSGSPSITAEQLRGQITDALRQQQLQRVS